MQFLNNQKGNGGNSLSSKWGVREGMKMLVTSSLFTVTPRPVVPSVISPVDTSSKTPSVSPSTVTTVKEGPSPPPPTAHPHHPPPLVLM